MMAGLGGSMRGGSGSATPNSMPGSAVSMPNSGLHGGLQQHGSSGPSPSGLGGGGISASSIGPGGVCMDFLSARCPRGAACPLSHTLPQTSLPQASSQMQQQQLQSYLQVS